MVEIDMQIMRLADGTYNLYLNDELYGHYDTMSLAVSAFENWYYGTLNEKVWR